ncbi:putative flavoprotein [Hyaloraphidium curvatum]|nr:putative flavoprotein [Hyaloraphidium curvatum]
MANPWDRVTFDPDAIRKKMLQERDRRLRSDHLDQYITVGIGAGEKYTHWLKDPWTEPKERAAVNAETTVLIVGAGFGGLQMAVELEKKGVRDFLMVDKAGEFGGCWFWNRFPGVRCDMDSMVYVPLLEDMGHCTSQKYAPGEEILEHCRSVAQKYGLYRRAMFSTGVLELRWDDAIRRWRCTTDRGDSIAARFAVMCAGPINLPHLPNLPGLDTFKGKEFHTARWDGAYSGPAPDYPGLKGKRIAVIGTGSTGVQVIPEVARVAGKLFVVQRTPAHVDPADHRPSDAEAFAKLEPGWADRVERSFHKVLYGLDPTGGGFDDGFAKSAMVNMSLIHHARATGEDRGLSVPELIELGNMLRMDGVRKRVDEVVKDKRTAELLKPWYAGAMCKRNAFSDSYLECFNQDNVELVDASVSKGVERVTEDGIVVGGKYYGPLDCIVWCTGFEIRGFLQQAVYDFSVFGRGGLTKREKMEGHGGWATMFGVVTSGFPNLFEFTSTQAATAGIFPSFSKFQSRFSAHVISLAVRAGHEVVECTREAEEAWVAECTARPRADLSQLAQCTPGYYNAEGDIAKLESMSREQSYWGGPLGYWDKLDEYIKRGDLDGFRCLGGTGTDAEAKPAARM